MNPGTVLLVVALVLALGVVVLLLMVNRPEEGMLPWLRESFMSRPGADPEIEPQDVSLAEFLNEAEEAPEDMTFELLARR